MRARWSISDLKEVILRRWRLTGLLLLIVGALALWASGAATLFGKDTTWAEMQGRGTVRVGLDPSFPPFELLDANGAPIGFDVDLANALAQQWGLRAEIVAIGFDSLIDALRATRVDLVISAMPFDERLTEDVTYSRAYFEAGIRLAVQPGTAIGGPDELAGKRVAVEWGSLGDMIGRKLQREQQIALQLAPFDTPQAAIDAALHDSSIAALLIDNVSLRVAQGQGAQLVAVGPPLESNPYVIVMPKRSPILSRELSAALDALEAGKQLAALQDKWFGPASAP